MLNPTSVLRALGPIDIKSVLRDSMLRWLVAIPLAVGLLGRWGVPIVRAWVAEQFAFDLMPYYPLLMSFFVLMVPALLGTVVGFLLLDQRDDRTLTALHVTPLTVEGYLMYRTLVPIALSVAMIMVTIALAGLVTIGWVPALLAAIHAALITPLYALFLGAFAANKVQGFALAKAAGPRVFRAWRVAARLRHRPAVLARQDLLDARSR